MVLNHGDKLLVTHRRLYREDQPRYFIGAVKEFADGLAKVEGRLYVRDTSTGKVLVKDIRTEIIAVTSGTLVLNVLPEATNLDAMRLYYEGVRLMATDDADFQMDLSDSARSGAS